MHVLGRDEESGQVLELGVHRAPDGSDVAPIGVDLEHPHTGLVVGKRGAGKSHTVAVLAEGVAAADGVTGLVVDPMGGLRTLAAEDAAQVLTPVVRADAVPPRAWCSLLDLDPAGGVGGLVWRVAREATTLEEMLEAIEATNADQRTRRAASNHLRAAEAWSVFGPDGIGPQDILTAELSILDLAGVPAAPANAVVRALLDGLYETMVADRSAPLPWVFIDEAHTYFDGVARPGINRVLTRGRHPGLSTVLATQRPAVLPAEAVSQADLLVAHRLTAQADLDALETARPTYLNESLRARRPAATGEALVVDDHTEVARAIRVRDRRTPDGGATPVASDRDTTTTDGS